jgi:hypothetical protein
MRRTQSWPPWEVTSLKYKLNELAELVAKPAAFDHAVLPWMSRILVVRSSGFVEQTAKEVCRAHVSAKSGGRVRTFAMSWLEQSKNPSPDTLCELVGRFDLSYQDDLLELLEQDDQRIRRELAFMVDRRNRIAHGLNESITRDKALLLWSVAIEVSDWFILRFNPY